MTYLLDSNIFIQAKNMHYSFDFCPAFWDWLDKENESRQVFSIEKVRDELIAGDDALADWARERGTNFFLPMDSRVLSSLGTVSDWVNTEGYDQGAVSTFLQVADYFLVAHAHAHNFVVVTHEIRSSSIRKVKIPNVCHGLGVKFMTPYEMLRIEKAQFVLGGLKHA